MGLYLKSKIKQVSLLAMLTAIFFVLCACSGNSGGPDNNGQNSGQDNEVKIYCPLDQAEIASEPESPPLLVSIDNLAAARPQSGLEQADIVYEIPAEGGVSRFLALYYHGTAGEIGPVRSARPYFVDIAREYEAVFVHAGGSQDALDYLDQGVINSINEFSHGKYFWRDKSRKMPHNLYTSSENLAGVLEEKGWNHRVEITPLKFNDNKSAISVGVAADSVEIDYPSAHDIYRYDGEKGLYLRFIKDEPHCDRNTGDQLSAANIIVQYVTSQVLDNEGRLAIDMTGEGKAMFFTKGQVLEGKWERPDLDSRTMFCNSDGEEWFLSPGQTWIQVVDQNVKVTYQSEEAE